MSGTAPGERPVERSEGVSAKGERFWGIFGGALGALVGLSSALIAVYVEIVKSRTSRFPRTDASGATLLGTILMAIGGLLLFTGLVAITSAR